MNTLLPDYWTVLVPYVSPKFQTQWHPLCKAGPFAVLSRGAFATEDLAIAWAQKNLNGTPYTIKSIIE